MAFRRKIKAILAMTTATLVMSTPALASISPALPNPATQGTVYSRTFSYGGQSCTFRFYFGNYGGGYANVRIDSSNCAYGKVSIVSVTNGNYASADAATGDVGGPYAQAHTPGKNLLQASYCIELQNGNNLLYQYNALNNTLDSTPYEGSGVCA